MNNTRKKMQALLAEVEAEYDFEQFTMEGFIYWLQQRRGREIVLIPYPISTTTASGAWLAGDDRDFVFYDEATLPIHQTHIQLHEMAHMLCGHPTLKVGREGLSILFRGMVGAAEQAEQEAESLFVRFAHSREAEREAEVLASLIQKKVLHYGRMRELLTLPSSHQSIADFIVGAELG
jgi:hypothetical protein